MVQVIGQGRLKPKSTSQQFGEAFSRLAQGTSEHLYEQKQREMQNQIIQQREAQENQQLKQLTGIDFEGLSPEIKKSYLNELMKGKNQENLANIKGKFGLEAQKIGAQNKGPAGGLSGQAVPQEVSLAANKIIQQFPNASADQLKMMMDEIGIPPAYSNGYVENRRRQDERIQASKDKRSESGQKRAEKVLDFADKLGEELPVLESSVMAMEDAVVNGDQSFWSPDNIAEMTGLEFFRTAKGGQFKTAAKTYFINDLKSSGARPNQFLEKQFVDALAKVGRSQEANQTVLESFKFTNDLKRKRLETIRNLEKFYEESTGYLPGSFNRLVEEQMEPYVKDRQKEYERRLKDLAVQEKKKLMKGAKESKLSGRFIDVLGPDGQLYEVDESEVGQLPEGYRIQ